MIWYVLVELLWAFQYIDILLILLLQQLLLLPLPLLLLLPLRWFLALIPTTKTSTSAFLWLVFPPLPIAYSSGMPLPDEIQSVDILFCYDHKHMAK